MAAARGHIECIRCLLETVDGQSVIDCQDKRGSSPLHLALRRNHSHVALLLLHSGLEMKTRETNWGFLFRGYIFDTTFLLVKDVFIIAALNRNN